MGTAMRKRVLNATAWAIIVIAPNANAQSWELEQFLHGFSMRDIAATGVDNIWIAGFQIGASNSPLLLHFNGSSWRYPDLVDEEPIEGIVGSPWSIEMAPWGEPVFGGRISSKPFAAIVRGGKVIDTVSFDGNINTFSPIDFSIPSDDCIWMSMNGTDRFARWDGSAWESFPLQEDQDLIRIYAIDALSSDAAWAVGEERIPTGAPPGSLPYMPLVAVWNGKTWSRMTPPTVAGPECRLYGVEALAPNDIWVVGEFFTFNYETQPAIFHWDGAAWTQHFVPRVRFGQATGIVALAPDDIWVQGNVLNRFFHFDGVGWRPVRGARELDNFIQQDEFGAINTLYRLGGLVKTNSNELLSVGYTEIADMTPLLDGAFIERLVTHPPQTNSADVNNDGRIDSLDLQLVIQQFGLTVDD